MEREIRPTIPEDITRIKDYIDYQWQSYELVTQVNTQELDAIVDTLVDNGTGLLTIEEKVQVVVERVKHLRLAIIGLQHGDSREANEYIKERIVELNRLANFAFNNGNYNSWMVCMADMNILKSLEGYTLSI